LATSTKGESWNERFFVSGSYCRGNCGSETGSVLAEAGERRRSFGEFCEEGENETRTNDGEAGESQ